MQNVLKLDRNSLKIKKNKRNLKKNSGFILIDLSAYNVHSIANVVLGYGVYCLLVSFSYVESVVAFKYL